MLPELPLARPTVPAIQKLWCGSALTASKARHGALILFYLTMVCTCHGSLGLTTTLLAIADAIRCPTGTSGVSGTMIVARGGIQFTIKMRFGYSQYSAWNVLWQRQIVSSMKDQLHQYLMLPLQRRFQCWRANVTTSNSVDEATSIFVTLKGYVSKIGTMIHRSLLPTKSHETSPVATVTPQFYRHQFVSSCSLWFWLE